MLTLHYTKGTIASASAIALNEAGASYQTRAVDFANHEQQSPDYLTINPKGRVPALITSQGVITETIAILEYIGATHPDAGLIPDDPFEAAQMRSVMSYLASTMHVAHAHKLRGPRWASHQASFDDMTANVPRTMGECCGYLETHVLQGAWVVGDRITLADPYLYTITTWLNGDGVDIADYPKLAAFASAMAARPSVVKARADSLL